MVRLAQRPRRETAEGPLRPWWANAMTSVAVALLTSHCYSPGLEECNVRCDGKQVCPSGLVCSAAGVCASPGQACSPPPPRGDAATTDATVDPMPRRRCVGTVEPCSDLLSSDLCQAQTGCRFIPQTCNNVFDCLAIRLECDSSPACKLGVVMGNLECIRNEGFCQGTNKNQCERQTGCAFVGGCEGMAASCVNFAEQSACERQAGCQWQ